MDADKPIVPAMTADSGPLDTPVTQALLPVTPEAYCLGLITEEAGEVLQLVGKALRFGIDTPGVKRLDGTIDYALTSRSMLPVELGDLLAGIDFAVAHGLIDADALAEQRRRKFAKLTDPSVMDNLGRPLAPQPPLANTPAASTVGADAKADEWLRDLLLDKIQFHISGDATADEVAKVIESLSDSDEYDPNVAALVRMPKWCYQSEAQKAVDDAFARRPSSAKDQQGALTYLESEARRIADMYSPQSDGRNTFTIFADKIAALAASSHPNSAGDETLREALAPFAEKASMCDFGSDDYCPDWSPFIPVSAYRNAARALSATPAQEDAQP